MVIFYFLRKFSEINVSQCASFRRFALTTGVVDTSINSSGNTRKINDVNNSRIPEAAESPTTA
jgi:hypothetical protein